MWAIYIGNTTYRSTLHVVGDKIIVNSNGDEWKSDNDPCDGVYIINAKDGTLIRQIVAPGSGEIDANGVAVVGDSIYFGSDDGRMQRVTFDGDVVWDVDLGGDVEGAPVAADFNGDGAVDIAVGAEFGHFYILDGKTGATLQQIKTGRGSYGQTGFVTTAAAYDVTGDGVADVFAPGRDGTMRAIDGKTGALLWSKSHSSSLHAAPIIVDEDNDGRVELIYAEVYSTIYSVDPTNGAVHWKKELRHPGGGIEGLFSPIGWHPGARCALVSTAWWGEREGLYCVNKSGVQWRFNVQRKNVTSGSVVGDIDGKPGEEIVFGTEAGHVHAVNTAGARVWTVGVGAPIEMTPTLADVTGDGRLEILVAANDGVLRAIKTRGVAPASLGYYRGDPQNTGVLQ